MAARQRRRTFAPLILILWGAMVLRFYHLGLQSFWNDEGNAARLAERSLALIVKGAAMDIHPPGYYLLLHFWQLGAGRTEFALRAFSALCSLLTVAVVAALGRSVGGRRAVATAAILMAWHPLAVYYAQEARMYALLGLLAALTLWAGERLRSRGDRSTAVMLAALLTAGLYTHYAYLFAIAALNGAAIIEALRRSTRRPFPRRLWLAANGFAALAFLPWLPHLRKLTTWKPPDLAQTGAFTHLWTALLVGTTHPAPPAWLLWPALALLLWGTVRGMGRRPFLTTAALLLVLLPPLLFLATGSYRPAYLKFLLVSLPALTVLIAAATAVRTRWASWLACLLLVALFIPQETALDHLYHDPAYRRTDYRGIAALIAAEGRPGDAVVLDAPNQWEVFTYYYRGPLEVFPAPYHPDPAEAQAWLATLLDGHERLFVLYWGEREADPQGYIERGLAERSYKAGESWIGEVRLARYGVAPLPEEPTRPLEATFGSAIRLEGTAIGGECFRGGEIIPISLFWRATAKPATRYKLFVHLLDAAGNLVAQYDGEPVGGFRPTDGWEPEERLIDRCGLLLPASLPPGRYRLRLGLYDAAGTRLPVRSGGEVDDGVLFATLELPCHDAQGVSSRAGQ